MNKFLKDNKGVSLIELVVVIAILMVLTGVTTFSYRMVSNKTVTQCAENMKISLEKNKTTVMGKKNGRIAFYTDGDGAIYMQEQFDYSGDFAANIGDATKIGKPEVEVYYNGTRLGTTPVVIEFTRGGALKSGSEYLPLTIKKNNTTYSLTIDSLTGKVNLEKK